MLLTDLPNLYIKKYGNLLQFVRVMIFLCATAVLLRTKKAVDMKLPHRISRDNEFSWYSENAKSQNVLM